MIASCRLAFMKAKCGVSISSRPWHRQLSDTTKKAAEAHIEDLLIKFFKPSKVLVKDTSGGCGAMFDISIESSLFKGKTLVAQHKMVTQVLQSEIKNMHGLTIKTKVSL